MTTTLFPDLVVNGQLIPHSAVAAEAQNHDAPKGKPGIAWRRAANALAVRTLLLQEARARGLVAQPQRAGGRVETDEEALIRALLEAAVDVPPVSVAEIRAVWEADPSRFRSPPLWEVSHILCAATPGDEAAVRRAQARATDLSGWILGNPDGFARIAARESNCPSKANGGALGQIGPGDSLPEFEAALRGLEPGRITPEPVRTRHGWHVIKLDACAEGQVLPFEAVRPRLALALEKAAWAAAARDFVAGLVARAEITGADPARDPAADVRLH